MKKIMAFAFALSAFSTFSFANTSNKSANVFYCPTSITCKANNQCSGNDNSYGQKIFTNGFGQPGTYHFVNAIAISGSGIGGCVYQGMLGTNLAQLNSFSAEAIPVLTSGSWPAFSNFQMTCNSPNNIYGCPFQLYHHM